MLPRSSHFSIIITALLISCAEHAPIVDQHPLGPTPPAIAPVDGGSPPTVAILERVDAGVRVDAGGDVMMASTKPSINPAEWLDARGISATEQTKFQSSWDCEEVVVGTAHEPALACTTVEDVGRKTAKFPMDRILAHRTVNVARGQKMVKVLDVLESLAPLDKEGPSQANIVDLALHVAPDGLSAKVDEHTEFAGSRCSEARAENLQELKKTDPDSVAVRDWAVFDRDLIARICGSMGEFEWKKDRFARRIFTDALPMGAPKPPSKETSGYGTGGF